MTFLISLNSVQQIKKQLGQKIPDVKSSHRVEAMARGFGWKTNAALRAALMCAPTRCSVDDEAFEKYLAERGFTPPAGTLSSVVEGVFASDKRPRKTLTVNQANSAQPNGLTALFASKAALVAAFVGAFMAISYLYLNALEASKALDRNVEQILSAAEGPATRSVLIMDQELAREVVSSFTVFSHIKSATVVDDHGTVLATKVREQNPVVVPETVSIAALFVRGDERAYTRALKMPPSLATEYAALQVVVDQKRGLAIVSGPTLSGLILFFLLGAAVTFALIASMAASRRMLHRYLVAQYSAQLA